MSAPNCKIKHYTGCGDNEKYAKVCLYPEKNTAWTGTFEPVLFEIIFNSIGAADKCGTSEYVDVMPVEPDPITLFFMRGLNGARAEQLSRTIFSKDVLSCTLPSELPHDISLKYYHLAGDFWLTCRSW